MVELDTELGFEGPIEGFGAGEQGVDVPAFGHPASGDRIDDAGRNFIGGRQGAVTDEQAGVARFLEFPCQGAAGETCANNECFDCLWRGDIFKWQSGRVVEW